MSVIPLKQQTTTTPPSLEEEIEALESELGDATMAASDAQPERNSVRQRPLIDAQSDIIELYGKLVEKLKERIEEVLEEAGAAEEKQGEAEQDSEDAQDTINMLLKVLGLTENEFLHLGAYVNWTDPEKFLAERLAAVKKQKRAHALWRMRFKKSRSSQ